MSEVSDKSRTVRTIEVKVGDATIHAVQDVAHQWPGDDPLAVREKTWCLSITSPRELIGGSRIYLDDEGVAALREVLATMEQPCGSS